MERAITGTLRLQTGRLRGSSAGASTSCGCGCGAAAARTPRTCAPRACGSRRRPSGPPRALPSTWRCRPPTGAGSLMRRLKSILEVTCFCSCCAVPLSTLLGSMCVVRWSERYSHRLCACAHTQLLSGRLPATQSRTRPSIPLAAGAAFRRWGPSVLRRLSAQPPIGHSPPSPVPAVSGRPGMVRSRDQASLAPDGTRPVS